MTDGNGDDSIVDRVKRVMAGPTARERAERLNSRTEETPGELDDDDLATLRDLLTHEDDSVVGNALGAAELLAVERPGFIATAAPELVACLHNRPAEEWASTTLGEADRPFMNDLLAGSALHELATADPGHLAAVADDLAALMRDRAEQVEPHTLFAVGWLAAAGEVDIPVSEIVEPVADTLQASVDADDDPYGVTITVATREEQVELLGVLDHPRALDALRHVEANADDGALAAAAAEAAAAIEP
jgi:hypothetical protein